MGAGPGYRRGQESDPAHQLRSACLPPGNASVRGGGGRRAEEHAQGRGAAQHPGPVCVVVSRGCREGQSRVFQRSAGAAALKRGFRMGVKAKVVLTDYVWESLDVERKTLDGIAEVVPLQTKKPEEVLTQGEDCERALN